MIGVPLGLLGWNVGEWLVHKHILHGLGRRKGTFWSFHWHEHHKNARRAAMRDGDYERPIVGWHAQAKEALGLAGVALASLTVARRAPWFAGTVCLSALNYYRVHKRSHRDPAWARAHLTWHYDHHMAPNQHANWCVTFPWFDHVMGTREPYAGTAREAEDIARREAKTARVERDAATATSP